MIFLMYLHGGARVKVKIVSTILYNFTILALHQVTLPFKLAIALLLVASYIFLE